MKSRSMSFSSTLLLLTLFAFHLSSANTAQDDKARALELKQANVELAKNTTIVLAADSAGLDSTATMAEQLYRMVFKRNTKDTKKGEEEVKKEETKKDEEKKGKESEDLKTTTAPSTSTDAKQEKSHHKHKGHHKKHKHHHKHHHKIENNNGTEVDWHSIG